MSLRSEHPRASDAIGKNYSLATTGHKKRAIGSYSVVTTCCPPPPASVVDQAFDAVKLEKAWRDPNVGAIVHHGPAIDLPGFNRLHSHTELLAIFAHRDTDVESVSVSRLIDGLMSGADLGDSGRPILRHSGELNQRALRFALEQLAVQISELNPSFSFGSYAELASAGTTSCGPLIIGLRGKNLRRRDLRAVRLEGYCPLARSTHKSYPLQYGVHFYLRKGQSRASLRMSLAYLEIIKLRMGLDNELFSDAGGLIH